MCSIAPGPGHPVSGHGGTAAQAGSDPLTEHPVLKEAPGRGLIVTPLDPDQVAQM